MNITRMAVALVLALPVGLAWGQGFRLPTNENRPYVGVINAEDVNIRSGPNTRDYACTQLDEPATVTVVRKVGDWLMIQPPEGCFSAIVKDAVVLDPNGRRGTVQRSGVKVRPAGDMRKSGLYSSHRVQLNRGHRVTILPGEIVGYFKIVPPRGAYFYVSAKYVTPKSQYTPKADTVLPAFEPATTQPSSPPPLTPATTTRPADPNGLTVPVRQPPEQVSRVVKQWKEAEAQLATEFAKPVDERNYKALLATYQAIPVKKGQYLQPYVASRIQYLSQSIDRREQLKRLDQIVQQAAESFRQANVKKTELSVALPTEQRDATFAAKGILHASELFPGNASAPKRWLIRDPLSDNIRAYIQTTTTGLDLSPYVGKYVGIYGPSRFDKQLALDLIEAQRVVEVEGSAPRVPVPQLEDAGQEN